MNLFKRILSLFCAIAIVVSLSLPARAVDISSKVSATYWDWYWHMNEVTMNWVDVPWFSGFLGDYYAWMAAGVCASSDDGWHHSSGFEFKGSDDDGNYWYCRCLYCLELFKVYAEDLSAAEQDYISTLDSTTVSSPVKIPTGYASYNGTVLPDINKVWSSYSGSYPYAFISAVTKTVCDNLGYTYPAYRLYLFSVNRTVLSSDGYIQMASPYSFRYYLLKKGDGATSWQFIESKNITGSGTRYGLESTGDSLLWVSSDASSNGSILFAATDPVYPGNETVDGPDAVTRTGSLMQTINNYNFDNDYTVNPTTVNYFIGSLGSDGSVTDVYSPALYDEETLVFTEPVSGNQYQTNGWTYDYTTRTYYMTLDPGTMYIDGTEVTAVYLVYGDDNVEISYLSGSGATELIQTDTFSYVMVSQSACNINGHTYTYEDVSDPTCTASGERKYTCSICGNEYAEEIPATGGHAYEYSIYQAATCTADGTGLYTCSTCGDQYTEPITATGHIDQILESVPTVYDEEGIVVSLGYTVYECTVCGDQRRVNDEIAEESQGLISGITSAIVSFAKAAWSAIASGIGKLFSGFADLLGGIFGFFTDTVIGGVKSFFGTLSDDSILGYYQDDTGTAALPEGVGSAMAMIPAFFGGLPVELQAPVIFGIAALFLIAALKLFL